MQRALATHCRWKHEQVELGSSPEELRDCDDSMTSEQELVTTASSITRRDYAEDVDEEQPEIQN